MSLTPQWLDELRARTTLSALIGRSIKVTRAGREHKACCPFHNEKTPSFTINDEKGFYHCFGCGAHGDAIRWMTEQRGLSFMDAVKELAATAGMDVPAADPKAAQRQEAQKSLRDVTEASARWFGEQLGGVDGAVAREYLARRRIGAETHRAFGFGYAPDSRTRLKAALAEYPTPMLVEAGMLIAVDDKDPYDRFRGRLMIPIRDARGRVIAFGGRILGDGEPKYLNSPDTPLFDKGRTLYNLDRASPASRRTSRILVVEGYMDVVALAQAGIDDAVAPLGTALTETQIAMLWRMVPVPVLCLDGDAAGQKAAMRAAMRALPLLRPGFSLAFVTLPAGQDPDDVVAKGGAAAMETLIASAEPLVDRLWAHTLAEAPVNTPEERAALKQRLRALTEAMTDPDVRHHYGEAFAVRLAQLFDRPRQSNSPAREAPRGRRTGRPYQPDPRLQPPLAETRSIGKRGVEANLADPVLGGLLRYPDRLRAHADELAGLALADRESAVLLEMMLDAALREERLDTQALLTILEPSTVYNKALALLTANGMHFSFNRKLEGDDDDAAAQNRAIGHLDEAIGAIAAWPDIEARLDAATSRFRETMDEASFAEQQRLRAMKDEMTRRLAALAEGSTGD
jgi:DNA primase